MSQPLKTVAAIRRQSVAKMAATTAAQRQQQQKKKTKNKCFFFFNLEKIVFPLIFFHYDYKDVINHVHNNLAFNDYKVSHFLFFLLSCTKRNEIISPSEIWVRNKKKKVHKIAKERCEEEEEEEEGLRKRPAGLQVNRNS